MDKKDIINELTKQIWDLKGIIHIWNFIYGKNSTPAKVDEFTKYFTPWICYELQRGMETKILIDLRAIIDRSGDDVSSIYKLVTDKNKLIELERIYSDIRKFVNTSVAHKNLEVKHTYTFKDVNNTLNELQKLIDEENIDCDTFWDVKHLIDDDLNELYEKVKRVNKTEK